ncbi:MAG: tape measure protein, partial [Anaerolineales bacterium]|nr:tape measure protein [Anaerolineales bacterium]
GKALAVQGGAASESAGALRQLSQSFSSGIVRAEEFNSLLEGAFPLALAAAEGLDAAGGSVGRLRNLITQGEVTSREFFEAILKGGSQLDEQFAQTVATLSQSFTVLGNSFLSFVGQIDSSLAGTSSLATAVIGLASTLDNFGAALQGTLDEQEELSGFFEVITVGVIGIGAGFGTLFDILNLGRLIIVDVVESLAGAAAAGVQALQGNFAGALEILNSNAFDDTQAAATDFFEDFETRVDRASDKISEVLIPSFRAAADAAEDATGDEGGGGPTGPTDEELRALEQLQASQADFLEGLLTQEAALAEAQQSGRDYNEVLEELALASLAAGGETEFLAQAVASVASGAEGFEFGAQQAIEEIRRLEAELEAAAEAQDRLDEAREERTDILETLREENEALRAATEAGTEYATALEILAIQRAAQGDEVFLEEALRLREANEGLREGLDEAEDQITDFSERARSNAQDILSGFLADPAAEGLDQLPAQFSRVLADLASEALA